MTRTGSKGVTRRWLLSAIAGASAAVVVGCDDSESTSSGGGGATSSGGGRGGGSTTTSGAAGAKGGGGGAGGSGGTGGGTPSDCAATPEGEIGPYFTDDSDSRFNRSNIVSNLDGTSTQEGIPLKLTAQIVDAQDDCAPYANAQVDIWHCNAEGVYSNESVENTSEETWLRGYQITDSSGNVTFQTILPGWYQGRTTHIHLRVRSKYSTASSTSDGGNTTQLFFSQSLVDTVATSVAPYSAEGVNDTTNASDHVYTGETHGENVLTLSGSATAGFIAACIIRLPITSA